MLRVLIFTAVVLILSASVGEARGYTLTHYGAHYNGQSLGCQGAGLYSSSRMDLVAVGPPLYSTYPCYAPITLCGDTGVCLNLTRLDSCPGCGSSLIDTTEAVFIRLCGNLDRGVCPVTIGGGGGYTPLPSPAPTPTAPVFKPPSTGDGGLLPHSQATPLCHSKGVSKAGWI